MTKEQTHAMLVDLGSPISIPGDLKDILKKKNALMVVPESGKKIILFPTDSSKVVKVSLELKSKGLSPLFFNEISRITKDDLKVNILYTSGLCFAAEKCVWDGFFEDHEAFTANIEEVKQKFLDIDGVMKAEIKVIEL